MSSEGRMIEAEGKGAEPVSWADNGSPIVDTPVRSSKDTPLEDGLVRADAPAYPSGSEPWLVTLGAFMLVFCSFGYMNAFGTYQTYYKANQLADQSQSAIAWIGSVQLFGTFFLGIPAGALMKRYNARVPTTMGAIAVFLSIMFTSACKQYYQFFLAQGVLSAIGFGLLFTPGTALPSQWFAEGVQRNVALSVAISGSACGGIIWPIMIDRMLNYDGLSFAWTVRTIGFVQLVVLAVGIALGRSRVPPTPAAAAPPSDQKSKVAFTDPSVLTFSLGALVGFLGLYTPFFFIPQYSLYRGVDPSLSFYMLSILNAGAFPGRAVAGVFSVFCPPLVVLAIAILSSAILAFVWTQAKSTAAIIVWTLLYGLMSGVTIGSTTPAIIKLAPRFNLAPLYLGIVYTWSAFGSLAGEPIAGHLINLSSNSAHTVLSGHLFDSAAWFTGGTLLASAAIFSVQSVAIYCLPKREK